jgi:hypothetical protein
MLNRAASWMLLTAQMWISESYGGRSALLSSLDVVVKLTVDHFIYR